MAYHPFLDELALSAADTMTSTARLIRWSASTCLPSTVMYTLPPVAADAGAPETDTPAESIALAPPRADLTVFLTADSSDALPLAQSRMSAFPEYVG